jgi:integration host factor subunit beta
MEASVILHLPWPKRPGLKAGDWPREDLCGQEIVQSAVIVYTGRKSGTTLIHTAIRLGPMMTTTTKKELINRIAGKTGTKQGLVKGVVQQFFDEIIAELAQGNRLEFRDFGVFDTKTTPARTAQNPKTLEKVEVPAKRRAVFKPGRLMRDGMNGQG